uniref:Kunitz-type serine protease inhibitor bitisilin-3-like n=1 Tax=Xiphophorus maculatus TaxID=8083 RepID=M3ZME4_XIPMA
APTPIVVYIPQSLQERQHKDKQQNEETSVFRNCFVNTSHQQLTKTRHGLTGQNKSVQQKSVDFTEFCNLPSDPGQGTTFTFFVYYKHEEDKCLPFFYQGQGGNANRFKSERECMRNCSINSEKLYPTDETAACRFKYAAGGCNSYLVRYYYDSIHDKCKKFLWSGCFGNGNRFFDFKSCNRTCVGIHGELITISSYLFVFFFSLIFNNMLMLILLVLR